MGFLGKAWRAARGVLIAVAAGAAIGFASGGPLGALIGAGIAIAGLGLLGVLGAWVYVGFVELVNATRDARRLSARTQRIMAPFFPPAVLDKARLVDGASVPGAYGVTIGATVFLAAHYRECGPDENVDHLAHELVHVRQYVEQNDFVMLTWYGCQAVSTLSHDNISYEQEAIDDAERIRTDLHAARDRECATCADSDAVAREDDWAWLLHGG